MLESELEARQQRRHPVTELRDVHLLYHNREFADGYAKPRSQRSAFNACMPVRNSSSGCWQSFQCGLEGARVDFPGSNRSRGWADNALVEEGEHIFVPYGLLGFFLPLLVDYRPFVCKRVFWSVLCSLVFVF